MTGTRCAIVVLLALIGLSLESMAHATPVTPSIAIAQTDSLKMRVTSSTGTSWSWTFVDSTQAVVATAAGNPAAPAFPAAGDYTARLDAFDADPTLTAPAHAETTFHVYAAPAAGFTYTVLADGTVQFTDTSTGAPTAWTWTFPSSTYQGQTPPPQALPAGTSNVRLKVANPGGIDQIAIPVIVQGPPVAVLRIVSSPAVVNSPVLLDAGRSSDPNNDPLTYSWDLNGDQTYGDAGGAEQSVSYPGPGTYRVGVQVSDGHGGLSTAVGSITVTTNHPPVVSFTNAPAQPAARAPVTFTAKASDPDGTVAKIEWDLDGDGQFDNGSGPKTTWSFPAAGSYIVAVRATDDQGLATVAFRTITVTGPSSVPPTSVAPSTTPSPSSAPGQPPPGPASSSTRPTLLAPFPVVRIRGLIFRGSVRISLLRVSAPPGTTVRVVCHGRSCPAARSNVPRKVARKPVRLRTLERRALRPGTSIELFITAPGRIGKYTRFTVRRGKAPARTDLCLRPGGKKPTACPTQ